MFQGFSAAMIAEIVFSIEGLHCMASIQMTSTEDDCPFCAIAKAYPHPIQPERAVDPLSYSHIVASTPHTLAFLDRLPLTKCHTLLISRDHYQFLSDIPPDVAAELGRSLPVVCRAVMEVSGSDGFNVVQNNGAEKRKNC